MQLTTLIPVIGVLVALTNIVVQVLKQITPEKLPTNVLAVIVAMVITLFSGCSYCQLNFIGLTWHIWLTLVVAGFLVAYAAMFGFDKLREAIDWGDRDE